jgi:hypothetical protein
MLSYVDEEGQNVVVDDEAGWKRAVERAIHCSFMEGEEQADLTVRLIASLP